MIYHTGREFPALFLKILRTTLDQNDNHVKASGGHRLRLKSYYTCAAIQQSADKVKICRR